MKKKITSIALALLFLVSCGSVPITGRKQILLVPNQEILSSSLAQYRSYISKAPRSSSVTESSMVTRVGKRIAAATEAYLRANGLENEIKNFAWEFNLVKDNQLNAFCMPGGKIVVYEGLLKIINSDDELAVVLGHEVAHAVAKHSNERMSQQMLAQAGAQVLNYSLSQKSALTQMLANQIYGLGAQLGVMLPFSRKHESEADYMGLILMRLAGYNPEVAVGFWKKMSAGAQGKTAEFLSTHPSDEHRIRDIQKALPVIEEKFKPLNAVKSSNVTTEKKNIRTIHIK